jgi:hypothetical protein
MVPARHDRRARGRTERGGVEVVEPKTIFGELVDIRRIDQTAEASYVPKTRVIEKEDDDVRRPFRRLGR